MRDRDFAIGSRFFRRAGRHIEHKMISNDICESVDEMSAESRTMPALARSVSTCAHLRGHDLEDQPPVAKA